MHRKIVFFKFSLSYWYKQSPGCNNISGGGPPLLAKCSLEELEYSSGCNTDPGIGRGSSLALIIIFRVSSFLKMLCKQLGIYLNQPCWFVTVQMFSCSRKKIRNMCIISYVHLFIFLEWDYWNLLTSTYLWNFDQH